EERTQALEALLKSAGLPRTSLDAATTTNTSNQHFLDNQAKRLREALNRRKPAVDNSFAQLRAAERKWNAALPTDSQPETYDLGTLPPAIITVEVDARRNPLENRAYDQRTIYPWRRSY